MNQLKKLAELRIKKKEIEVEMLEVNKLAIKEIEELGIDRVNFEGLGVMVKINGRRWIYSSNVARKLRELKDDEIKNGLAEKEDYVYLVLIRDKEEPTE